MKKSIPKIFVLSFFIISIFSIVALNTTLAKTTVCVANQILPDTNCTPGVVLTTNSKIVCVVGYTKTVRNVSTTTKKKVFAKYGIPYSLRGNYEVDHLISLELGGSNDISNLWPENSSIISGSLTKDKFENYLHKQVCNGSMTLTEAQKEISTNWLQYYSATLTTKPKTATNNQTKAITPVLPVITPVQNNNYLNQNINFVPIGATGKCKDNTYTYAINHRGACSHHGGVEKWY